MRIVFVAYREWAFNILGQMILAEDKEIEIVGIVTSLKHCGIDLRKEFSNIPTKFLEKEKSELYENLLLFDPELILFYGWSWLVKKEVLDMAKCICLHPSLLPKYRGGSPIQNQILAGERKSGVSLFFMTEDVDNGSILAQREFSLDGELNDIFNRIKKIGFELTLDVINKLNKGKLFAIKQNEAEATYCGRRKPKDSEITIKEIQSKPAEYIYNKIRSLQDPYPNAYIICGNGKMLYLTKAKLEK